MKSKEVLITGALVLGSPILLPVFGIAVGFDRFQSWKRKDYPAPWVPGRGLVERIDAELLYPLRHYTWKVKQRLRQPIIQNPRLPFEICELIIDYASSDIQTLKAYSLVCRDFLPRSRLLLISQVNFRLERSRSNRFITLVHSPFFTLTTIAHLSITNERRWSIVEGVVPLLASRGVNVEYLDLTLQRAPKTDRSFPLRVAHLRIRTSSHRGGVAGGLSIAQFISTFSDLRVLTLNLTVGCTRFPFLDYEVPPVPFASSLNSLTVKCDHSNDPILHWLLSKCTNLVSIQLFVRSSQDRAKYDTYFATTHCKDVTHLGFRVGLPTFFRATSDFRSYSLTRPPFLLTEPTVLPNLISVHFTYGTYMDWQYGYENAKWWYQAPANDIAPNLDALMANSKNIGKVTVKCGDESLWYSIEDMLRRKGFALEHPEGKVREFWRIVDVL